MNKKSLPNKIRKRILSRDKNKCQKCESIDETGRNLDIHHITPAVFGGNNSEENLVTLCRECHYYAPNDKEDFEAYVEEKLDGPSTMMMLAFKKFREKYNDEEWKLFEERAQKE